MSVHTVVVKDTEVNRYNFVYRWCFSEC